MFRSLGSSIATLAVVIVAGFMLIFISKGSSDIAFHRVAMAGDQRNAEVLAAHAKKIKEEYEVASYEYDDPGMEEGDEPEAMVAGGGPKVVLWISIPGFRTDYIEKSETPFFDRMTGDGADTDELNPNFPCLTYPAHAALATGTTADNHGIPLDVFRDESGNVIDRPMDGAHLRAEPIWTTATRQGIRTLVHDWPLSQNQSGEHAAAFFHTDYDPQLTDQQRLDALWQAWSNDQDENKLRLLMIRLNGIMDAAMEHGPREDGTYAAVSATDQALADFFKKVEDNFESLMPPDGSLSVIVTTDHGLADLEKNINLPQLLTEDLTKNLEIVAHDGVGHLFFKDLPENAGQRELVINNLDDELRKRTYFRTLKAEDLPGTWNYNIEGRTGDRILVLQPKYAFTDETGSEPVFEPSEGPGRFAGFGFPVESSSRMKGQAIIWGYPESPASGSLGTIDFLPFHATVCKLLGIQPAETASKDALRVD